MKRILSLIFAAMLVTSPSMAAFGNCAFGDCSGGGGTGDFLADGSVPMTGDITLENAEIIDNGTDGIICLQGAGGTNNEDICFDLESFSNSAIIQSNTGATLQFLDDFFLNFGSGGDLKFVWETTGNDNFQIGTRVAGANGSGYVSLMESTDIGNANRSPSGTSADPVFRVYSSDETNANDYGEFLHDQTRFRIQSPSEITIDSAGSINLDSASGRTEYYYNGSAVFRFQVNGVTDQAVLGLNDSSGNQLIISNYSNTSKDHDHATTTDPTLFIHSDTDPDTDNTQYMSLYHDQTDAWFTSGTGDIVWSAQDDIRVDGTTAGFIPASVTSDPCGSMGVGSIFYNSTSNYHCFCNGAGADIKMNDNTTACF